MYAAPAARPHIDALTSLRFFAALGVILMHSTIFVDYPAAIQHQLYLGRTGVSFFFILSGFILTYTYHERLAAGRSRNSVLRFYWARFARVFPMHVVALLLMTPLVLYVFLKDPGYLRGQTHTTTLGARDVLLSWFSNLSLVQIYFPSLKYAGMWNGPSWSIACEAVFYAVFPFALPLLARIGRPMLMTLLLFAISTTLFVLITRYLLGHPALFTGMKMWNVDLIAYRQPLTRIYEFLIGIVLGLFFVQKPAESRLLRLLAQTWGRNLVLMLCISFVVATAQVHWPKHWLFLQALHWYVWYMLPFALVILTVASGPTFLSFILDRPLLRLLGEASYSLYITHWVIYAAVSYAIHNNPERMPAWANALVFLGAIGFSVLCYSLIEDPARNFLRDRGPGARRARRADTVDAASQAIPEA